MEASRIPQRLVPYAALFLLALAIRLVFIEIPPYGDEGAFYYTARNLADEPDNVHDLYLPDGSGLYPNVGYRPVPIFWYRPLHFLLLFPAAQFGFDAYRAMSVGLASFVPPLVAGVLTAFGTRRIYAFGGGAAAAVLPYFVVWGVITLPDTLMTMWLLAGLLAYRHGRSPLLFGALLAAAWTKETAMLGIAAMLGASLVNRWRSGWRPRWPLEITRREAAMGSALALGPLPLAFALWLGGAPPGGLGGPDLAWWLEGVFGVWLLIPLVVLGFVYPPTRILAALALVYPIFYFLYGVALDRSVNIWYLYPSATLALVAATAGLDAWDRARSDMGHSVRPSRTAAVLVAVLLVGLAVIPTAGWKTQLYQPFTQRPADSLLDAFAYESSRDGDLAEALALARSSPNQTLFVVDVYGSFVLHPLATSSLEIWWGETDTVERLGQNLTPWPRTIERTASRTLVEKTDAALNLALREVYADCMVLENARYAVIDGNGCQGRADQLAANYEARLT